MNELMASIICSVISGLCVALPSVISTKATIDKNNALQDERIMELTRKLDDLTDNVQKHNNFGIQIAKLETRVEILEKR